MYDEKLFPEICKTKNYIFLGFWKKTFLVQVIQVKKMDSLALLLLHCW
jgi:hypothetical protein